MNDARRTLPMRSCANQDAVDIPLPSLPASNVGVNGTCPHRTPVGRVADSGTRGRAIDDVARERSVQHAVPTDPRGPAPAGARAAQPGPGPKTSPGTRAPE